MFSFRRGERLTSYNTGRKPWRSDPFPEVEDPSNSAIARRKLFYFGLLTFILFGALTLQLVRMQLVNGATYRMRAETNRLRQVPVIPTRGLIFDRNGIPLVENRASFAAAVVAADFPQERQMEISIALQEITGVPATEIIDTVETRRASNDPFSPAVIKDNLTTETAFTLRERLAGLPGVRVIIDPKREYREGPLISNVLGYVGRIDADEYEQYGHLGYQMNDYLGKSGVEYSYESVLRGRPGSRDVETDASGRELRILDEEPMVSGSNIVLSLDLELQRKTAEFLQAAMGRSRNAAAVVIDVNTGELLALVSLPTYDNNMFSGEIDPIALEKLLTDPNKPLVDHAITEMYPPGSIFKQVTGLAALQEGVANANTQITSRGSIQVPNQYNPSIVYTFRDWSALGTLNFYRGVAMSSDVYFYYLSGGYSENGREIFQGLGSTRLAEWARRFGLGDKTGIDLPGESEGLVPDSVWKEKTIGETWTIGDTYNFGIGQGYLATTPLQMAVVTAAVANGGNVLTPHVVKEIRASDGRVMEPQRQYVRRNLNVDLRNLNVLREGMRQAVADGTAKTGASRFVSVAGKTGTAEFGERRPDGSSLEHGWFTGYAPVNNPQIAISIFLEQGNGAITAAPVAARIFDYYFSRPAAAQGAPR